MYIITLHQCGSWKFYLITNFRRFSRSSNSLFRVCLLQRFLEWIFRYSCECALWKIVKLFVFLELLSFYVYISIYIFVEHLWKNIDHKNYTWIDTLTFCGWKRTILELSNCLTHKKTNILLFELLIYSSIIYSNPLQTNFSKQFFLYFLFFPRNGKVFLILVN